MAVLLLAQKTLPRSRCFFTKKVNASAPRQTARRPRQLAPRAFARGGQLRYLGSFETTRNTATAKVSLESFRINRSKPIIDEIDELLAKHYGFTEEELDFIINYDIKYRMGDELNVGGGE